MNLSTTLLVAALAAAGVRADAQQLPRTEPPTPAQAAPPRGQTWVKALQDRSQRGTLQDRFHYVRGDSGKWNDDPILQHAPPIGRKPETTSLDDWAEQLRARNFRLTPDDENWLLLSTRQLDDNDRVWVERIERNKNHFTIVVNEAIWQGKYSKTFTYYSVFGVNLGSLEPGQYKATCVIKPLVFKQFDGDGRPTGNWSKDERPAEQKPIELNVTFNVAAQAP